MLASSRAPRISTRFARAALATLPALVLAACGGGGGGSEPASAPPEVQAVAINSTNQVAVAADALDSATNVSAANAGASFVTGAQVQGDPGATVGSPAQLAAAARKFASMVPASSNTVTGVAVNETVNCELGGTLTLSGDIAGGNAIVAGDTLTISASNCKATVDGATSTMNGSMTIRVVSGSVRTDTTVYPIQVVMSLTARNFSIESGGITNKTNGDLQIDLKQQDAVSADMVLSGNELTNSVTSGTGTRSGTLKSYRQTLAVAGTLVSNSVSATVEATNGRLGTVSYQVSTPVGLTINNGTFEDGSLRVAGQKSVLLMTVTAPNTFKLELDADGNGTYESSKTVTLDELKAQL